MCPLTAGRVPRRRGVSFRYLCQVSRLSFRTRLFLALLTATVLPVVFVTGVGVLALREAAPTRVTGGIDDLARTYRTLDAELRVDTLRPGAREALARHRTTVEYIVDYAKPAVDFSENIDKYFLIVTAVSAVVIIVVIGIFGTVLTRQLSAPLDEVVEWTGRIQRHEPLGAETSSDRGIPEFAKLRSALRNLERNLDQARAAELEAERLRAFGEVARRVAHEMKNPLTPIRLAVLQLSRTATPEAREMLDIIGVESARLEAMAREFAELGRLPEGIAAPVDLRELLDDLLRSTVPDSMIREFVVEDGLPPIDGHYDPLRRAFSNILRNAVDACRGDGSLVVRMQGDARNVEVMVSDNGPGVPHDKRELIFRPYYTEKGDGTGLGLAIVRQTIEQHHGTITVTDTPGGGATFLIRFPA